MNNTEIQIDFQEIFLVVKNKIRQIVAISIIVGILAFLASTFFIEPKYSSYFELYVTNLSSDTDSDNVNVNDLNASLKLVNSYTAILQTGRIVSRVVDGCGLNWSNEALLNTVKFSIRENTEVLCITVTTSDPFLSARICDEYAKIAPDVIQDVIKGGSVTVLSDARPNGSPSSPNITRNTLLGFIGGFIIAAAAFIIFNYLDNSIKNEDELANKCNVSVIGTVPDFFSLKDIKIPTAVRNANKKISSRKNAGNQKLFTDFTVLGKNSSFIATEAYNMIRTNLMFSLSTSTSKIAVVSSSLPNECKSTTTVNIAISMVNAGSKVLLIDGDLRNPTLHRIFQKGNKKGLSRILAGFDEFENAVIKDVRPGLDLLPGGPIPPNASGLLNSANMENLIHQIESEYDFIFIDSPPINVVADAMMLAQHAAGIILVARESWTKYNDLNKAIAKVETAQSDLLGIIITSSERITHGYGGYGKYGYGYGYGYGSSESIRM